MADNTTNHPSSQRLSLEESIRHVLSGNFDADSKTCFLTLLKIIDNILQKPGNDTVRALKVHNKTIQNKILSKGGHHTLRACGFVHQPHDPKWRIEERWILLEANEDTETLIKARHTIARIAVLELGLQSTEIPPYRSPPKIVSKNNSKQPAASTGFDVYSGSRFDGQSAAIGTNLGAPQNWKSKTEQELETLKQREAKLLQKTTNNNKNNNEQSSSTTSVTMDGEWTVSLPGQAQASAVSSLPSSSSSNNTTKGDSALLAEHFQQQHAKRLASQNRGFTTKAMRDLEKLKKTKIYSHTQLAIHFPDGISLKANFSTKTKIQQVQQGMVDEVFVKQMPKFDLYQTPPRIVMDPTKTLAELGLVPAAKVYVSWKTKLVAPSTAAATGWYLRQNLGSKSSQQQPAMPTSVPVAPSTASTTSSSSTNKPAKRKQTKADKEAALLKRMMGKGGL